LSQTCRGRHGEVGIVEFGLYDICASVRVFRSFSFDFDNRRPDGKERFPTLRRLSGRKKTEENSAS